MKRDDINSMNKIITLVFLTLSLTRLAQKSGDILENILF